MDFTFFKKIKYYTNSFSETDKIANGFLRVKLPKGRLVLWYHRAVNSQRGERLYFSRWKKSPPSPSFSLKKYDPLKI